MSATAETWVKVGRIGRPFGLKGEVVIHHYAAEPERFADGAQVFVLTPAGRVAATIAHGRPVTGKFVAAFAGRESIDAIRPWVGCVVEVPVSALPPLEEGTYYHFQLLGLQVYTADGKHLGEVSEILGTGANDVLRVRGGEREHLIPLVDAAVADIDLEGRRVVLAHLEGLLEL
jgi:16S rRNA processing protein RimM